MAVGVFLLCTGAAASGPEDKQHEPAQTEGILPLPDYGGDLWTRTHLLGDLGGARSDLAEKGLQFGLRCFGRKAPVRSWHGARRFTSFGFP